MTIRTQAQLLAAAHVIGAASTPNSNTTERVEAMLADIVDTMYSHEIQGLERVLASVVSQRYLTGTAYEILATPIIPAGSLNATGAHIRCVTHGYWSFYPEASHYMHVRLDLCDATTGEALYQHNLYAIGMVPAGDMSGSSVAELTYRSTGSNGLHLHSKVFPGGLVLGGYDSFEFDLNRPLIAKAYVYHDNAAGWTNGCAIYGCW